ncbi:hypothetical protein OGR47_09670 [Methylocystis sp. MJC1]|uniref:AbiU2 domain-containing protein n=1 Tax=Methylocystis sp. MJC1 TaxID=2654282 RepID=UPI0013EDC2BF|nr:hypothetical protein [Methylocystis sp. MJC1]KAF2992114.1 hypothetical protein MJC1_00486 [Methylocystis sp. MJC1]MBU6527256.1 hypothetical protein [Methylocystis sp. MJC1]UZX10214.1 hypothetical protein OGR47_09670 [Methylocystis sp. MJC1]
MNSKPIANLNIIPPANPNEDIVLFANNCVFMRSIYLHHKILFERSSASDKNRMSGVAAILFADLNRIFIEYVILQVCKITDPAQDARKNDNHTVAFLLQRYDFISEPAIKARLAAIADQLQAFRNKLVEARNKLISHADRNAILAGLALRRRRTTGMSFGLTSRTLFASFTKKSLEHRCSSTELL